MKRPKSPGAIAGLLVLLLSTAGCSGAGGQSGSGPGGSAPAPNTAPTTAQQELAYGRAPVPGGGITYRPDVILVGGGAAMVRSVSGDSLTWSIDARAPHLDELKPGKVMFLTGRAVGRVLNLEPRGDVVAVTLGPVDLTDVISDGDININGPIDVAAMNFQTFPGVPGMTGFSSSGPTPTPAPGGGTTSAAPAVWSPGGVAHSAGAAAPALAALPRADDPPPLPPPSRGSSTEVTVGDFSAELGRSVTGKEHELSLKVGYTKKGVTIGLEFTTKLDDPTIVAHLGFKGGALTKQELQVNGLKEVSVGLVSGSETGLAGNFKSRIEVPAEITVPWAAGPVPLVLSFRFKFIVTLAFSARNATLSATSKLKVDGPIGFSGPTVLHPTVTQTKSPVDTMAGVSVGINSVVFALQLKVVIGIGIPAAFAGPFAALTVSYGLLNGSAIGIVQCKQSTIDVVLGGGLGITIAPAESTALKKLLENFPWKPKVDSELLSGTNTVLHKLDYQPKVAICKG